MANVSNLLGAVDRLAPLDNAADWDNVGLLVGRGSAPCDRVLLCIDLTEAVLEEAIAARVQAIVAYHPVVFEPRTEVSDRTPGGALLVSLIESGIAVVSPHTALDAAPEGMGEWLASGIGAGKLRPIDPTEDLPAGEAVKLITYAPRDAVDAIRCAVAEAGAGRIGAYDMCSTAIESVGTFRPGEDATPTVGARGELEHIDECRVMLPCSARALPVAIEALRAAHPYEEPPVHVIALSPRPHHDSGMGRIIELDSPADLTTIAGRLRDHLGVASIRKADAGTGLQSIAACCPGAGGSMWRDAAAQGATVFVTGEMRYHDVLEAVRCGMSVLLAGHTNTERGYLPVFADRLRGVLESVSFDVSTADRCLWTTD